jgi:hypothetical protein
MVLISALTVMMSIGLVYSIREFTLSPQGTVGITAPGMVASPAPFANVSFSNASGFVTIVHPTNGTIEFVLLPNGTGQITVSYSPISNNLSQLFNWAMSSFPDSISAPKVNLSSACAGPRFNQSAGYYYWSIGTPIVGGLNVTQSSLTWVSSYQVIINYTITSGGVDGLYVLGLPSTFLSTYVNVGTQPYTGPLTWLNEHIP